MKNETRTTEKLALKLEDICKKKGIEIQPLREGLNWMEPNFRWYANNINLSDAVNEIKEIFAFREITKINKFRTQEDVDKFYTKYVFDEKERREYMFNGEYAKKILDVYRKLKYTPTLQWLIGSININDNNNYNSEKDKLIYLATILSGLENKDTTFKSQLITQISPSIQTLYEGYLIDGDVKTIQTIFKQTQVKPKFELNTIKEKQKYFLAKCAFEELSTLIDITKINLDSELPRKACAKYLVDKDFKAIAAYRKYEQTLGTIPEDLINMAYNEYCESKLVDAIIATKNTTGRSPNKNLIQKLYNDLAKEGEIKEIISLQRGTEIIVDISESTIQKGYLVLCNAWNWADVQMMKSFTNVEPDKAFYENLAQQAMKEYSERKKK